MGGGRGGYRYKHRAREREGNMNIMILFLVPLGIIGIIMLWIGVGLWLKNGRRDAMNSRNMPEEDIEGMEEMEEEHRERDKVEWKKDRVATEDDLSKLVKMMSEKLEREESERRDEELVRYARNKSRSMPPSKNAVMTSNLGEDRPVNIKRTDIAVPYHISELDKQILEEFYNE